MARLDELLQQIADPSNLSFKDETYDIIGAQALVGADRATYVAKLVEVAQHGDTRASMTLGHMNAQEAVPMLQAEAQRDVAWASSARRALVLLGHGDDLIDAIANDVLHSPDAMIRIAAVMDLKKLGGSKAFSAFDRALEDPEYTVRSLAWEGIASTLDLEKAMRNPEGRLKKATMFELLRDFLASDIVALRKIGVDEIRRTVEQLAGGASPADAGAAYSPEAVGSEVDDRMIQAMYDEEIPYPITEVARVSGVARRRVEALLATRAMENDPRVAEALVRLDASWTVPVLEEIMQSPKVTAEQRGRLSLAVRDLETPSN